MLAVERTTWLHVWLGLHTFTWVLGETKQKISTVSWYIHMQQLAMEGGLAWEAPINRFMRSESKSCRALWPVSVSQGSYHQESGCTVPFFIIWTKRIFTESKALECIYLFVFDFRLPFAAQQRKDRLACTSVYFSAACHSSLLDRHETIHKEQCGTWFWPTQISSPSRITLSLSKKREKETQKDRTRTPQTPLTEWCETEFQYPATLDFETKIHGFCQMDRNSMLKMIASLCRLNLCHLATLISRSFPGSATFPSMGKKSAAKKGGKDWVLGWQIPQIRVFWILLLSFWTSRLRQVHNFHWCGFASREDLKKPLKLEKPLKDVFNHGMWS